MLLLASPLLGDDNGWRDIDFFACDCWDNPGEHVNGRMLQGVRTVRMRVRERTRKEDVEVCVRWLCIYCLRSFEILKILYYLEHVMGGENSFEIQPTDVQNL